MTISLERRADLDLRTYRQVAWHGEAVQLNERAIENIDRCRKAFLALIDSDEQIVIYGVTSGYGQHAYKRFSRAERKAHAAKPPLAAAVGFGKPLPQRLIRGIVLARLANFMEGHAAVSSGLARAVADMLAAPELPCVPGEGITSAGEIIGLSHLFAAMAAARELGEKEALALINGAPVAAAMACDAALSARPRLERATAVLALSAEAMLAPLDAYDCVFDELWEDEHQAAALADLRRLLDGGAQPRRGYQAPVSYRILPRVLGQARAAVARAENDAASSLRAVSDNPVFVAPDPDHPNGRVLSNGGYHDARAVVALDGLTRMWADLALLCDRHLSKLMDSKVSLLPQDLMTDEGGYMGCTGFAAADLAQTARTCAVPSLLQGSEGGGFGQNDVALPAPAAWQRYEQAGRCLDGALAALAAIASQALFVTGRPAPPSLADLLDEVRTLIAPVKATRLLGPELERLAARFDPRPASVVCAEAGA